MVQGLKQWAEFPPANQKSLIDFNGKFLTAAILTLLMAGSSDFATANEISFILI